MAKEPTKKKCMNLIRFDYILLFIPICFSFFWLFSERLFQILYISSNMKCQLYAVGNDFWMYRKAFLLKLILDGTYTYITADMM